MNVSDGATETNSRGSGGWTTFATNRLSIEGPFASVMAFRPADRRVEYVRGSGPSGRIKWSRRPCTSADTPAA